MNNKLLKLTTASITGMILLFTSAAPVMATEHAVAGFVHDKTGIEIPPTSEDESVTSLSSNDILVPGFNNIGIADVDTNLLVREKPSEDGKILGKMPKNSGCEIIEPDNNGWTKVQSGKVTGYVKSEYLISDRKPQN